MFSREDLHTPLDFAKAACDTLMHKFAAPDLPPKGGFHYHAGVFLSGMQKTWHLCKEQKYFDYAKEWVDSVISEEGVPNHYDHQSMDDFMAGFLLFDLYEATGDEKYLKCLNLLMKNMREYPRTAEGGHWHKGHFPNQMWLDGLYMGGPICVRYGAAFQQPCYFDTAINQAQLMEKNTIDEKTGLLYHAFDYSREAEWADPVTGKSPEFWGRSIGWVPVALLDELDYIPKTYFQREKVEKMVKSLLMALIPFQDDETGLWYQVVNKGGEEGNWLETSCSCLYVAGLCKAVRTGLLDRKYLKYALKGYEGVISRLKYNDAGLIIDNVCIGTGVGDYKHYCERPTSENDLHGAGAFILMCQEVQQVI